MPRPRAGDWLDDEMASLRQQGLDLVVSLLVDEEVRELELDGEQEACARSGLQFMRFPVSDRDVPLSPSEVSKLVATLIAELQAGRSVGIHCRIGIGRSAVLAVCVLAGLGVHIEKAWEMVQRSRGLTVPDTSAQRAWPSAWFATEKHANCRTRIDSSVSTDPGKNGLSDFQ